MRFHYWVVIVGVLALVCLAALYVNSAYARPARSPLDTPTPTFTGTPPTPCGESFLANGGFESGSLAPWVVTSSNPPPAVSTAQAHTGSYAVLLGTVSGPEPAGDSAVYQTFVVPWGSAILSFWYWPVSADGNINNDWQDVYITDAHGNNLTWMMHVVYNTQTWTRATFNLDQYVGQTIGVKFLVHQAGNSSPTAMYVDDVSVSQYLGCGITPTWTFTPGPPTSTATPSVTRTPTRTGTTTPTGTPTVTGTPPSATPTQTGTTATPTNTRTAIPPTTTCCNPSGTATTSCAAPDLYHYDVALTNPYPNCGLALYGPVNLYFQVSSSPDPGGSWTNLDDFFAGNISLPPMQIVHVQGDFSEPAIPPPNAYYRVQWTMNYTNCLGPRSVYGYSTPAATCPGPTATPGTPLATVTPARTPSPTSTPRSVLITEFPVPSGGPGNLRYLAAGPDGNVWFVESGANKIGRITPQGAIQEFSHPSSGAGLVDITTGPDNALWFTEYSRYAIGRMTLDGSFSEFPVPGVRAEVYAITTGPDGNLWFPVDGPRPPAIMRMTPSGAITEFVMPSLSGAFYGIAAGPDGNLWFTASTAGTIGRITPSGNVTLFPVPNASSLPSRITAGSDGNLWFVEVNTSTIGRITQAGMISEFPAPIQPVSLQDIAAGPDGNLWFTEESEDRIGCMTPAGVFCGHYPIPSAGGRPDAITQGPDGNLWFTEHIGNRIGRLAFSPAATPSATAPPGMATPSPVPTGIATSSVPTHTATTGPVPTRTAAASPTWPEPTHGPCPFPPCQTATPLPTSTRLPAVTATACAVAFTDVWPTDYFYEPVRYLACHGVISGYADGTFRPYNATTRAQMVKIVVLGFALPRQTPPAGAHTFADVPPSQPFFAVIEAAAAAHVVNGYDCGGAGEPCDEQQRPYFRPNANVTRGQLSKIAVGAAGWALLNPATGRFADVPPQSAFYQFVETAACYGIVSGYDCGGAGEPCDTQRRPYFRQTNNATRGQIAKIVYLSLTTSGSCGPPLIPR